MKYSIFFIFLIFSINTFAQKEITVEDIWQQYTFFGKSVPGFNFQNDGKNYTRLEDNRIQQYDLTTGKPTKVIFDASDKAVPEFYARPIDENNKEAVITSNEPVPLKINSYEFSEDESKILISTGTEAIYRRSSKSHAYVYDTKTGILNNVATSGKQMYTSFSPAADKVAYVRNNNLFVRDLASNKEQRITSDGKHNHIINGSADWVYEEEFSMSKSFKWSPDGKKIAFLRFDESAVKEFTMQMYYDDRYPENNTFKYPKVGEENAKVTAHIYDLDSKKITKVKTGDAEYFPRMFWTENSDQLVVFKMNRHQNELELLLTDANTGSTSTLLKETNKYYIDIHDNLTFINGGKQFLWTSEKDGYNHIYLYDINGQEKKQLTKGEFDVTNFYGYDKKNKLVFFQAAKDSPMDRQVYCVDIKRTKTLKITPAKGTNRAQFSSTFDYYVVTHSTANTPSSYTFTIEKEKKLE